MEYLEVDVASDGILSLSTRGDGNPYRCYLDVDGEPYYGRGITCDTCCAIFQSVRDDKLPLTPEQLSKRLEMGLGLWDVPQDIVDTVKPLLPRGKYIAALISAAPSLAPPRMSKGMSNFGVDFFWKGHFHRNQQEIWNEIILPLYSKNRLNKKRVEFYKDRLKQCELPTALAFSIVDVHSPMEQYCLTIDDARALRGQVFLDWTLAHFLIDGHHKVMAASQLNMPITILSFMLVKDRDRQVILNDETIRHIYGIKT
jgi:hypothetical protein